MSRRALLAESFLVLACATGAAFVYRLGGQRELSLVVFGESMLLCEPRALALVALCPLLWLASQHGLTDLPRAQRALGLAVRMAVLACLSLALAQPVRLRETRRASVTIAADVSDSVDAEARSQERRLLEQAVREHAQTPLSLIEFARSARRLRGPSDLASEHGARAQDAGQDTNLEAALQLAYGMPAHGLSRRLVIVSDGRQTLGDLTAEAVRAARLGMQIDYLLLTGSPPPELAIRALTLPDQIEVGRPFLVHALLSANRASRVQLRLFASGVKAPLDVRELQLRPGETPLDYPATVHAGGPLAYRLELTPRGADRFAANNRASVTGYAHGRARVLLIDSEPAQLAPLARALLAHEFEVEVRSALALPRTAAELEPFDFVLLSDVPAERVPQASFQLIDRYVREQGGAFMMAGGNHSFGLGGYADTPWAKLLPVGMAGEIRRDDHSLALALLIDCSGSMAGAKIDLAKDAARATVDVLGADDLIEVVGFAGEPARQVRIQSAQNRIGIMQSIARLIAQGGTQLFPALDMAYQDLSVVRARVKHVILLTDGQTQESGIPEVISAMRNENITVSTVGLGHDVNRELLQSAAALGGGHAYFTDDPHNVPRIFVHETAAHKQSSAVDRPTRLHVREPADFLKGIDLASAPPVRGYVATQPKPEPAQVLLESDTHEPLLARMRVGLGFSLAFTPDLKGRFSADLLRWSEFDRFMAQLVREHLRKPELDELPMQVTLERDRAHIVVDALDSQQRFIHGLRSEVELQAAGAGSGRTLQLVEAAPGRYEGWLQLPGFGALSLLATHVLNGRPFGHSHARIQRAYPEEYNPAPADAALLGRAAALTGGRDLHGDMRAAFRPARRAVATRVELWPRLAWLALVLYLIDLLLRRVRLFGSAQAATRQG